MIAIMRPLRTVAVLACLACLALQASAQGTQRKFQIVVRLFPNINRGNTVTTRTLEATLDPSPQTQVLAINMPRVRRVEISLQPVPQGNITAQQLGTVRVPVVNATLRSQVSAVLYNAECESEEAKTATHRWVLQPGQAIANPVNPGSEKSNNTYGVGNLRANNETIDQIANGVKYLAILFNVQPEDFVLPCPLSVDGANEMGWSVKLYDVNPVVNAGAKLDTFSAVWEEVDGVARQQYIPLVNTWNKTARIDIALVSVKAITRRNLVFRLYTTPCYDPAFVTSAAQYTDLSFNTGNGNLANSWMLDEAPHATGLAVLLHTAQGTYVPPACEAPPPVEVSGDEESSQVVSGDEESSQVVSGDEESSQVVSGDEESSQVVSGDEESSQVVSGDEESSQVVSGDEESSQVLSGDEESSQVLSGDEESSQVVSGDEPSEESSEEADDPNACPPSQTITIPGSSTLFDSLTSGCMGGKREPQGSLQCGSSASSPFPVEECCCWCAVEENRAFCDFGISLETFSAATWEEKCPGHVKRVNRKNVPAVTPSC